MDRAVHRRRGRGVRPLVSLGAVTALVLGAGATLHSVGWDVSALVGSRVFVEVDGQAVAVPRPAPARGRVMPGVAVISTGSHAFLHTDDAGAPVGYDPCRPIRYVVREQGMPDGGAALVEDAMRTVSAATGLSLVAAGTTTEVPEVDRRLIQRERYGEDWAPVLVAWSDESEVPELAGQVAGVGGSAAVPGADGDGQWLAAGRLVLDSPDLTTLLATPGGYERARAIVMHEIGHVLGLDHVHDVGELMNPLTSTRTDLGPGDRQGLALLGQVACQE